MDALADGGASVLKQPLIRLLLRLRASDAAHLSARQRKRLYSLLTFGERRSYNGRPWGIDLKTAILKALEQIGDSQAIPIVEHLAQSAKNENLRIAAQECMPFLIERAEQERNGMLLRPAMACDAQSATLLRAAAGSQTTNLQQLLRAGTSEDHR